MMQMQMQAPGTHVTRTTATVAAVAASYMQVITNQQGPEPAGQHFLYVA